MTRLKRASKTKEHRLLELDKVLYEKRCRFVKIAGGRMDPRGVTGMQSSASNNVRLGFGPF